MNGAVVEVARVIGVLFAYDVQRCKKKNVGRLTCVCYVFAASSVATTEKICKRYT